MQYVLIRSNNRYKARLKVAKLHEKITNQRKDFLNKLSIKLIRENQSIVIEDLRVKNMMKNDKLSKAIAEVNVEAHEILLNNTY